MRQIKFRAWEKHNSYMFDCDIISENKGYPDWQSFEDGAPSSDIIMQFTGLKDKNGKEIYEGDIFEEDGEDTKVYIKWNNDNLRFSYFSCYDNEYIDDLGDLYVDKIEVIGNIYENPELIK